MKDLLFRNVGLKVVALLLAVALWLVIREQVTDIQSEKLPVSVQFAANADSFLWEPVDADGEPVEALAIDVQLEGPASELSQFRRLSDDARSPIALLDPATFSADSTDHVEIQVNDLVMPGPIREGRVRINSAEPRSVRIKWRRIVDIAEAAVHPTVEWSEEAAKRLLRDHIDLYAKPPATIHVRGPRDELKSVDAGGTIRLALTDEVVDDLIQRLGTDPLFEDPSVTAKLATASDHVEVLGGPLEVRVRLSQRGEETVELPLRILAEQELPSTHQLAWSGSAQAQFTSLPGEPATISVTLTGSRLALSRQRDNLSGVYLWADPSSHEDWHEALADARRRAQELGGEDVKPTLDASLTVQLHVAGLAEGVQASDLPKLAIDVEPR